jgi:hypothetical protein
LNNVPFSQLSGRLDGFVGPIFVNRERLAKTFKMAKYLTDTIKTNNKQLKSSSQAVITRKHPKKWFKFQ